MKYMVFICMPFWNYNEFVGKEGWPQCTLLSILITHKMKFYGTLYFYVLICVHVHGWWLGGGVICTWGCMYLCMYVFWVAYVYAHRRESVCVCIHACAWMSGFMHVFEWGLGVFSQLHLCMIFQSQLGKLWTMYI